MRHFLKYYLITFAVFAISYTIGFFVDITQGLKAAHNIFTIAYPLIIYCLMIRYYNGKRLTYIERAGHWILYLAYVLLLIIIVGLLNPANMSMNTTERELGVIGIALTYGAFELLLGMIFAAFIRQKNNKHLPTTE